jgi:hypothetical protein
MKGELDAASCLNIVIKYVRGETNLHEAVLKLDYYGLEKKSAKNILIDTERDNVIRFEEEKAKV